MIEEVFEYNQFFVAVMNVGRKWYTDGKINKFCYECPVGFQPGMAYRKRGR